MLRQGQGRVVAKAGDRLWYGRSRSRGGSASGRLGLPSWRLSRTVCFYDRQSVSVTGRMCLWQTVCDRHSLCLSQTVSVCNIQSVSFTDSLCQSQTDYVCHRHVVSITDCLCPSQSVCVCHRQSMSVTDNLFLSQAVCVWHRLSSWSFLGSFLIIYTWFSLRFVREIWICPPFKHHQHQLCGPLGRGANE